MRLRIVTGRFVYYISVFQAQTFPEACVGKGVGGMPRASSGCAAALRADRVDSAGQMLQFPERLIVCNGRVNLRGADVFMAEKFADGFDRHALRERYGRGESVAGGVEREKTVDIRSADDFFRQALHQPFEGSGKMGAVCESGIRLVSRAPGNSKRRTCTAVPVFRRVV